jgi:antirestriction protein ArdC
LPDTLVLYFAVYINIQSYTAAGNAASYFTQLREKFIMTKRDIKTEITTKIIELIDTHGTDWVKPFSDLCGAPVNALTGKSYRGMNSFWLGLQGQTYWATYRQWQEKGAQVLKGSKSSIIAVPMTIKDKKTNEVKGLYFRGAAVFSAAQVEGWEAPELDAPDLTEVLASVDTYLANVGAEVRHSKEGRAYYSPSQDFIQMPHREQFSATATSSATECYYSTLLHEHTHWTGSKSRLDRLELKGTRGYAFEELVAEIGAAILCATLGVSPEVRPDHSMYIASWLKALTSEGGSDYIWKAASEAQKAVDYLNMAQESQAVAAAG